MTICLCMMVRDEADVIERCIDSVRRWRLIDSWLIVDTGSTDGTQEIIRSALNDLPGALYERSWVNFGHNRTELMDHAQGMADYLLLLDADDTITLDGELPELTADAYTMRYSGTYEYWLPRLVRGDRYWRYVGVVHEYLTSDTPFTSVRCPEIIFHHNRPQRDGVRSNRQVQDLQLLVDEHERDPSNPRTVFYLAQTLKDLGQAEKAAETYLHRATMGGWEEEVFYSLYQAGVLKRDIATLFAAWDRRPQRSEPLYELAILFRAKKQYNSAFLVAQRGINILPPDDILFVHRWMYEWGLLFEFSISAYWVGQREVALSACDFLLEISTLPESFRVQTEKNRTYCLPAAA